MAERIEERRRAERVASRVREELAAMLRDGVKDPRLEHVVLAAVSVTNDLSLVRVALLVLGDDARLSKADAAAKVLAKMEGGLRKRLAARLGLRRAPSLRFAADRAREGNERMESLLHEVGAELRSAEAARASDPASEAVAEAPTAPARDDEASG